MTRIETDLDTGQVDLYVDFNSGSRWLCPECRKGSCPVHDTVERTWRLLRTNNPLEQINREIRRRTRVVGSFPSGQSALMLVAARLRHIASTKWATRA